MRREINGVDYAVSPLSDAKERFGFGEFLAVRWKWVVNEFLDASLDQTVEFSRDRLHVLDG